MAPGPEIPDALPHSPAVPAESLLAAIVASTDDAIFTTSADGAISTWNSTAERMFGYTAVEIVGRSWLELVPGENRESEADLLQRLAGGNRVRHEDAVRVTKSGRQIDVSVAASPLMNRAGELVGVSMIARDISREKQAVALVNHLSAIVESSDEAIVSQRLDGTIESWNPAAQRMFGFTPQEIIGQSGLRLIPDELQDEERHLVERLERGERIDHFQTVRRRKDGTRIEVALTVSPIRDARGRVVGASKIVRDITRQRRAEDATRLLAAIVDSSDDAIVSKNLNGIITSWNAGAQRIFGYTAQEMIGRPVLTLIPPERALEEPDILDRLKRGERVDHFQTVRVRKDGGRIDVSVTISPVKNAAGEIVGASKVARDITQEKRAIAQLALANEALRRADRMKSEFLAVMSHELRTPLNSIIGFASVLRQGRNGPLTDDQKKQINLIHASGKHLLHLINDMLDLSRIESGRMELEDDEFAVEEVLVEVTRTLELQAAQKRLRVTVTAEPALRIRTDRKRFLQIILNLVNNAIKFTPAGSVTITAVRVGEEAVVAVADTGIGIAKENHGDLFQAFHQIEGSARRRYEGTGLGLYLCRKLATLLGGSITLESAEGKGSTFTVRLPLQVHFRPTTPTSVENAFA